MSAPAPTPTAPARLAIAGSTGSIGRQALDVVAAADGAYVVTGLGAGGGDLDTLIAQARAVRPAVVAVARDDRATVARLEDALPFCEVRAGAGALASLADDTDVVLNAVVGFAGLPVTMAALDAGRRLALANKESLVAGGPVVQAARTTPGAELVPVDSEHGAIHMCLRGIAADRVSRLVLTASGGPFRGRSADELAHVTVAEALHHPTWTMGPKITVDSSTLMNKGLEVIEAYELFGTPAGAAGVGVSLDAIDVVVHPQSIVHSMVELADGATIAQLSVPDMRLPIAHALAHPAGATTPFGRIDWTAAGRLDFESPDRGAFACLDLAYDAARAGGTAPAWLNAANEVAVAAFLDERLAWRAIADVIAATLDRHDGAAATTEDDVVAADARARRVATEVVEERTLVGAHR